MIRSDFHKTLYSAAVAGAALTFALCAPAVAQNTKAPGSESSANVLDEIVVTARRVEERLQDVPLAVSAFSSEELDKRVIVTHQDLNKLDPALFVQTSPPRGTFYPYMRGQAAGAGGAGNASVPTGVIPYFAEGPNIYPAFFDLANIQVIKGPQGTLFGETATGGVILFEPKRPGNEFEGYFEGQIGTRGHAEAEMALTFPIIGDKFSIRIAGQSRQRDGFTKIINSRPGVNPSFADNVDQKSFRISSVIRPLDDLEIYTVYLQDIQQSNGTSGILNAIYDATAFMSTVPAANAVTAARFLYFTGYEAPAGRSYTSLLNDRLALQRQLGPRAYTVNYDTRSKREYWALINQVAWNISEDITFKNITSLSQTSTRGSSIQLDASDLPIIDSTAQVCLPSVSPSDCMDKGPKPVSNEARVNGTLFDSRLDWQTGFYYRKVPEVLTGPSGAVIIAASPSGIPVNPATNCLTLFGVASPCTQLSKSLSESRAAYGQVTYEVVDGVHVTGGYRRTWDYIKSTTVAGPFNTTTFMGQTIGQSVLGTAPIPGSREVVTDVPRKHTDTYTLGADWKITNDVLVYVNHRKGYKVGGVNTVIPQGDPLRFYDPESVKDVELGMKSSFELGGIRIRSDLALFRTNFSDIQKRTSTQVAGTLLTYVDNVAGARIDGIELGLNIDPFRYFSLGIQYAYLDARFTNWVDTVTCSSDLTANGCRSPGATSSTLVVTDHVAGTKTANGVTDRFQRDLFNSAPKNRLVIAPTVKLGFLSERLQDASLSANITYASSMASGDINYSLLIPENDLLVPSRTGADLRFDWRNFMEKNDVNFDLFLSVTNVLNKTDVVGRNTFINLCGCVNDQYTDPRVVFGGVKAKF